jgi:two-component system cell cycle sensor histidine kinase/response regulator CckA
MSGAFDLLEHVPVPSYVFRLAGDDFVLEAVNAAGRAVNPAIVALRGTGMSHLYRDQPQILEDARRCIAERSAVVREMPLRRHDRTEATSYLRLTYAFFEPDHLAIFVQDIATPPMAQAALRESEARYRSLVASMPDAVLLRAADGRVLACNDVAARLFGARTEAELLGAKDILPPGYEVQTEAGERVSFAELPSLRVIATGEPEFGHVYALMTPESLHWIRVSSQPIRSGTGAVTGSVTTYTDITERVSAQRELRASAARLDLALAAAKMGVWEYELGADTGYWSRNLDEIFQLGYREGGFRNFLTHVHVDDRGAVAEINAKAAAAAPGYTFEHEFRILGDDDGVRWARAMGRLFQEADRTYLAGTIMDVTEQHRLEEELRRAHRLESIGRLAGGVAHDFNNLLTAIMGSTDLVEMHAPERARADLATIRHASERARDLTRQLLAFARKQPAQYKVIDLSAMVGDVERMLRRLVGSSIEMVLVRGAAVRTRADPSLLEQVLVNLVVNAREAMPTGGKLTIRVDESFGVEGRGDWALVEVEDSGVGMDDETRRQVFDPFFTTKTSGTGLGLASSYGIVKQHGGEILVESQPGHGTRFRVLLPRIQEPVSAVDGSTASPAEAGNGCVLVVDDDRIVRATAARMLESLGYEVLSAADAYQAVTHCERHPGVIDVLLCDIAMPGKDGPSVARHLRSLRPELKVVFVSGFPARPDEARIEGSVFLSKPYSRADLAGKLKEVVSRK